MKTFEQRDDVITIISEQSYGGKGAYGIRIQVYADQMPNLKDREKTSEIMHVSRKATETITNEIFRAIVKEDPKTPLQTADNKRLLEAFPDDIFVDEIPNGYCDDYYSEHIPWFIVTTKIGRFTIGWRRHVIHLEWTDTIVKTQSKELFPEEKGTKHDQVIHAWSLDDAKRYVKKIMDQA